MNTISSINSFAWKSQSVSVNTWDYISSKLAKTITFNISGGTNYVSLANTDPYANTAVGINQVTPNTTFLQCLSGSSFLKTSDFASSSFTFYVKYQMRNASLSTNVWNKQTPVITFSRSFIGPSQAFTVSFLSTYPVVNVPYTISGIVTGDISNAVLSGNLNGYNNTLSYVSSATSPKTFTFTAGGVTKSVSFLSALYTVTVAGGVFYISTNGGVSSKQPNLPFTNGGLYVFDQSNATNAGNRLVFGTGVDTGRSDTNVVFNGTPGSANAYTLLDLSGVATTDLYYFSATMTGMGYIPPPSITLLGGGETQIGTYTYFQVLSGGTVSFKIVSKTLYYILIGGGGGGASSSSINGAAGGGGGGGSVYANKFTQSGTFTFRFDIGGGGGGGGATQGGGGGGTTSLNTTLNVVTASGGGGGGISNGGSAGTTSISNDMLNVTGGVSAGSNAGGGTNVIYGVTVTLGSKTFKLCGGGCGATSGSGGNDPNQWGGGGGGLYSEPFATSGTSGTGGGGGGEMRNRTAGSGGSGCIIFYWS